MDRVCLIDTEGRVLGGADVDGELIVGRELIDALGGGADVSVSRRHGRLFLQGEDCFVEDLGSRNGTFVNGRRLEGALRLRPGDVIEVGVHRFVFGDAPAARFESGAQLYAEATEAAARAPASARLRLVYELSQLVEEAPARMPERLREVLDAALAPAKAWVRAAGAFDGPAPHPARFTTEALASVVAEQRRVLRRHAGDALVGIALPMGLDPDATGVVVMEADVERPLTEDDVRFVVTAATLAASAVRRAQRTASLVLGADDEIVGRSDAIARAKRSVDTVAGHPDLSVLLVGETGTGKELFARRLHARSGRPGPFVAVNVAALPKDLLEAELFGAVKGAFTGATAARVGYLERADGGTLFLDEVGEMPLDTQVKLLRVLQDRTIHRLGDTRPIPVDIRLVAATNADLADKMREQSFREDLYYRIANQQTRIPPLRERGDDLDQLVDTFIARNRGRTRPEVVGIEDDARALLRRYPWPGNVRQLEGTIRLAVIHAAADGQPLIGPEHLDERVQTAAPATTPGHDLPLAQELEAAERAIIVRALRAAGGNKRQAARLVQMSINTLRSRLKRFDIQPAEYKE